jgi:hypothetical protein
MRQSLLPLSLLCLLFIASVPALAADPAGADACAAQLKPGARSVYDSALPSMHPGAHLKAVLKHLLVPKVKAGEMSRHTARRRGEQAARCLELML